MFATRIHLTANIYEIMRKLYYILSLFCCNFWLHKDVHSRRSQVLDTFFILKTFLYLIDLHNLTDIRKHSFLLFMFSITQSSSIKHCEIPNMLFYLYIFRFFRLENHFCNFGLGDQQAGRVAYDSISWL